MSYLHQYHGRSPPSRGQFPIIVTKAKHILPAKRSSSSSRRSTSKLKSSRLTNYPILDSMNGSHHLRSNGSPSSSDPYGSVNNSVDQNGAGCCSSSVSYGSSYPPSDRPMFANNQQIKSTYKTNLNEEINRLYNEQGGHLNLIDENNKIKKSSSPMGYSETDGASNGTGQSNGKLIKSGNNYHSYHHHHNNNNKSSKSSKKSSKKHGKKRTGKQLQTFIMRRILLCTNIVSLLLGIAALVTGGLIDPQPLHRIGTTGGQISLASIYVIFISLVGLYGSRLKNYRLLFIYAYTLLTGLVLRSFAALLSVYIYHNANRLIFSMLFAIIEVILIFMGLAVAIDLKEESNRKKVEDKSTMGTTFKV